MFIIYVALSLRWYNDKVVNIYKSFKDRLILNNINFEVNKGETLVIIGGSGSGKSTLLKLLIGLLRPEQGQIFIDGKEISKLKEEELDKVRLNMGMVSNILRYLIQ